MGKKKRTKKRLNKQQKQKQATTNVDSLPLWPYIVILALIGLQYSNTLLNDYAYDDYPMIVNNPQISQGIKGIPQIWSTIYTVPGTIRPTYRPVPFTTSALEYQFFGYQPTVGHLFNIIYFGICCVLLFMVLRLIFWRLGTYFSLFVVLLFIVHPIHTESVANIKGRDDILCLIGGLLCLYGLLKYIKVKPHWGYGALSILGFSLGMFTKTNVITFLAVIPLVIFYVSDNIAIFKQNLRKTLWIYFPLLVYPIIYVAIVAYNNSLENVFSEIDNPLVGDVSLLEKWATIILIWGTYAFKSFIPYPLLYNYGFNYMPIANFADWRVWCSLLALLAVIAYMFRYLLVKNIAAFAIAFWIISLSIYGNVVMLTPVIMADRFLFIASLGVCIGIVYCLAKVTKADLAVNSLKYVSKPFLSGLGAIMLVFFILTFVRNQHWKDNLTLFSHDITYLSESVDANTDLVNTLLQKHSNNYNFEIANKIIKHADKAVELHPSSFTYRVKGAAHRTLEQDDKAEEALKKSLAINDKNSRANYHLGMVYYFKKDFIQAIPYLEKAVSGSFAAADKYKYLARAYCRNPERTATDLERAEVVILEGLQHYPNDIEVLNDVTRVFMMANKLEQALEYGKKAQAIAPKNAEVYRNFAKIYGLLGEHDKASQYQQQFEVFNQ